MTARTTSLRLGTGVTCPTVRYHPAIIAQAAATMAILSDGRFFLGIGSGERLNEHIVGRGWHSTPVRHEMLREAVEIIRLLWRGGFRSFNGRHLRLEDARIYDLPKVLSDIIVAASGPRAAHIAAEFGGRYVHVSPDAGLIPTYKAAANNGRVVAEAFVSFGQSRMDALEAADHSIRWTRLGFPASAEVPRAAVFRDVTQSVREAYLESLIAAGADPDQYLARAQTYAAAGVNAISFTNGSPDAAGFIRFAGEQLVDEIHAL
jgi:G6PDH family F420-dependent oxidoreductase